jgi:hypothetical protein
VTIKLNGITTVDGDVPSMPDEGIIGFEMLGSDSPIEVAFKIIEFTELLDSGDSSK